MHIRDNSSILYQLYQESPFIMLEKLLKSTCYGTDLLILVFHLSHLLLRKLLYPDKEQSWIVFTRLFVYQTD